MVSGAGSLLPARTRSPNEACFGANRAGEPQVAALGGACGGCGVTKPRADRIRQIAETAGAVPSRCSGTRKASASEPLLTFRND